MISTTFVSAAAAAAILSMASAQGSSSSTPISLIPTPTVTLPANAMQDVGCFETGVPLQDHGPYEFQSPGNCQLICIMLDKPVMGLVDGTNCWCGDLIPPVKSQGDNASCDTDCGGTDENKCGGPSMWWISLTGTTKNRIKNYEPDSSSSSSTSTSAAPTSATSAAQVATSSAPAENKSSGPNKAGIAAGVVVGVVALAAIIAGVIFFLRHKRRREVEEEYRRQAAVNSFVSGGKLHTSNSSMTDSRLDPEFMNRRQSNGSIADNEDYSRRILKVTNA